MVLTNERQVIKMTKEKIECNIGGAIRRGKGFWFNGTKYSSVEYLKNAIRIWTKDWKKHTYIKYEDVENIVLQTINEEVVRVIYGKESEVI